VAKLTMSSELNGVKMGEGVTRRVLSGKNLMLVLVEFEPGAVVPSHSHPHEQIGYVVSGRLRFTAEGVTRELGPGGVYSFAEGEEHAAEAVGSEPALAIDVFTPIRDDFLSGEGEG